MVWLFVLIPLSFMIGVVIVGSIKEKYFSQGYLKGIATTPIRVKGITRIAVGSPII